MLVEGMLLSGEDFMAGTWNTPGIGPAPSLEPRVGGEAGAWKGNAAMKESALGFGRGWGGVRAARSVEEVAIVDESGRDLLRGGDGEGARG